MPIEQKGSAVKAQPVSTDPELDAPTIHAPPELQKMTDIQALKELDKVKREKSELEKMLTEYKVTEESSKKQKMDSNPEYAELVNEISKMKSEISKAKKEVQDRDELRYIEKYISDNPKKFAFVHAEDATSIVFQEVKKNIDNLGGVNNREDFDEILIKTATHIEDTLKTVNKKRLERLKDNEEFQSFVSEIRQINQPVKKEPKLPPHTPKSSRDLQSKPPEVKFKNRDDLIRQILNRNRP